MSQRESPPPLKKWRIARKGSVAGPPSARDYRWRASLWRNQACDQVCPCPLSAFVRGAGRMLAASWGYHRGEGHHPPTRSMGGGTLLHAAPWLRLRSARARKSPNLCEAFGVWGRSCCAVRRPVRRRARCCRLFYYQLWPARGARGLLRLDRVNAARRGEKSRVELDDRLCHRSPSGALLPLACSR
jgi:hypothetical protein